ATAQSGADSGEPELGRALREARGGALSAPFTDRRAHAQDAAGRSRRRPPGAFATGPWRRAVPSPTTVATPHERRLQRPSPEHQDKKQVRRDSPVRGSAEVLAE